ncbi:VWA domain-containing protein [uncultured Ilumatobacter sp.]|uniref:vWA domain-containing protein n=1 Tax=uncultured Ilumatobacter sp. TaxID=879968 RepID=UPI00374EEC18
MKSPPPGTKEGDEADEVVSDARKKSTSRRELERNDRFEEISPEVGELDEQAIERAMEDDPDETMALLADLTGATDQVLRNLARRLAGKLFLDLAKRGPARPRGVGRLETQRYRPDAGDIDLDASIDALTLALSEQRPVDPEELMVQAWTTPDTAICLLVDRSGSMGGEPLATSAVTAASVAWRSPDDYSVLSFGKEVVAAKSQDAHKSNESVVDAVLALRGFGTTDVAGALAAARDQLGRSSAARKITILLSDCRATAHGSGDSESAIGVAIAARQVEELLIIAPADDDVAARQLAAATGSRITTVTGPSDAAAALARVLDT